jgi:hypothetical protein
MPSCVCATELAWAAWVTPECLQVPGVFYVNDALKELVFEELQHAAKQGGVGGFLPAVKQIANVAALPGIVKASATLAAQCSVSRVVLLCSTALCVCLHAGIDGDA